MPYPGAVIVAAFAFAAPLPALVAAEQSILSERYEAMGAIEARLGDATYHMIVPYDLARNRPHAEQQMVLGSVLTISMLAHVFGQDGTPDRPMLQIILQQQQGAMSLVSAEFLDGFRYDAPLVMGGRSGQGALVSFTLEDNVVSGTIEGSFLRLDGYAPNGTVADAAVPVPATLNWAVTLPPLE